MTDWSKLYDEFLYDCFVANQRLSEEDWALYGKERHHVEVPDREGGELTDLNSLDLTVYQHWVAGVLQSEVLGKCCFACVPKGVLTTHLENLRVKWSSLHGYETAIKVHESRTPEERVNIAKNASSALSKEQRSELMTEFWSNRTEEEKFDIISKGWKKRKENGKGSQGGITTQSQRWQSTIDGFVASAGNVARHNIANGWDPAARVRIS